MNESPGPEVPLRLKALAELEAAVYASLSAKDDLLDITTPFGEVVIPYSRIANAAKDVNGGLRLRVAGGATVSLDVSNPSDRDALFVLLQQKIMMPGGHPTSSPGR
jgi:hypothetical protein